MKRALAVIWMIVVLVGCARSKPETLVEGGYDEQEMEAAIARARAEADSFLRELSHPTGTNHAVKAAIVDAGKTEHFWLTEASFADGTFAGTINNEPGIVGNVKMGQRWTVKKEEISDWLFLRDGKMYGNYTLRPLLKTMPAEEADKLRSMLAEP